MEPSIDLASNRFDGLFHSRHPLAFSCVETKWTTLSATRFVVETNLTCIRRIIPMAQQHIAAPMLNVSNETYVTLDDCLYENGGSLSTAWIPMMFHNGYKQLQKAAI